MLIGDAAAANEKGWLNVVLDIKVRFVEPGDQLNWQRLFCSYLDYYEEPHGPDLLATVWSWIFDEGHDTRCLVAELDGEVVGIGHFRTYARTVAGDRGIYLEDLFTAEAARGRGVARAILTHLGEVARREDIRIVRWITESTNATAQALYDRIAVRTPWVTYDWVL